MGERLTVNELRAIWELLIGKVLNRIQVVDTLVVGFIKVEINSPVAQLVERLTVNQNVRGSSPRRGAKFLKKNNTLRRPATVRAFSFGASDQ